VSGHLKPVNLGANALAQKKVYFLAIQERWYNLSPLPKITTIIKSTNFSNTYIHTAATLVCSRMLLFSN